jgi:hypothetical protein
MRQIHGNMLKYSQMVLYSSWLAVVIAPVSVQAEFAGGTGTLEDPYQLSNSRQLLSIGVDQSSLQKHYILVNDIDLDPNLPRGKVYHQAPIAVAGETVRDPAVSSRQAPFAGTLDGNGHAIRNLLIETSSGRGVGLFAVLGDRAKISNLRLESFRITADGCDSVGLLAGINAGWVIGCHAQGHIVSTGECESVGGLVGRNTGHLAVIRGCTASCTIDGRSLTVGRSGSFGGLAGHNDGVVSNCVAYGDVSGSRLVGGLIGDNVNYVMDSFSTGRVRGGVAVGGLVGSAAGSILCCYSTGRVELDPQYINRPALAESEAAGGLVGVNQGLVLASFWDVTTSGTDVSSAGTGLTSEEMRSVSVYLQAGWDFTDESHNGTSDYWLLREGYRYPQLVLLSHPLDKRALSGRGTKQDPYLVGSARELGLINHYDLMGTFRLTGNIDLSGCQWLSSPIDVFDGTVEGDGHIVANHHAECELNRGLFGLLGRNAKITMTGIDKSEIKGGGGLANINFGEIRQCFAKGTIAGHGMAGGLVALNYGEISDCYSLGTVSGHVIAGGAIGSVSSTFGAGRCSNLYSTALVTAEGQEMRGGHVFKLIGGLVGGVKPLEDLVQNSYYLYRLDINDAWAGEALTDEEMKQPMSFAGWDFEHTWMIESGTGYPKLRWERD